MAKQVYVEKGLVSEGARARKSGFNLTKWLKSTLINFGVTVIDEEGCCPGSSEGFPLRLSADKSKYEYLDTDGTWKDSPVV